MNKRWISLRRYFSDRIGFKYACLKNWGVPMSPSSKAMDSMESSTSEGAVDNKILKYTLRHKPLLAATIYLFHQSSEFELELDLPRPGQNRTWRKSQERKEEKGQTVNGQITTSVVELLIRNAAACLSLGEKWWWCHHLSGLSSYGINNCLNNLSVSSQTYTRLSLQRKIVQFWSCLHASRATTWILTFKDFLDNTLE